LDKRYQVFISSTFVDLEDERKEVMEAIINLKCFPAGMEMFPASDTEQFDYIKSIIDESDYYVIIVAGKYGSVADDGISYTEKEFDYAKDKGIPILAFVKKDIETIPGNKIETDGDGKKKLDLFRKKILTGRVAKFWDTADELKYKIHNSLSNEFKIHPRPGWIRGDKENSEELLMQLNELRIENEQLKEENKIRKATNQDSDDKDIMENLEKEFRVLYMENSMDKFYRSVDVNCLEIIKSIGPKMINDIDREEFKEYLLLKIIVRKTEKSVRSIEGWDVNDNSIDEIFMKLSALKVIEDYDPDTFTLTNQGKDILYKTVEF